VVAEFGKLIDQDQQEGDLRCGGEVAWIRVRIGQSSPHLRLRGINEGGWKVTTQVMTEWRTSRGSLQQSKRSAKTQIKSSR
jgi:hypothetical protein